MTLAVLSSIGCPSIQVPPGKGLHKKTLFFFMLMWVVVNVPAGFFRGQKDVVNSKLGAEGYRRWGAYNLIQVPRTPTLVLCKSSMGSSLLSQLSMPWAPHS